MTDFSDYRRQTDALTVRYRIASESVGRETAALEKGRRHRDAVDEAREIVQKVAQTIQQQAHGRIASVVTRCLAAVFDDPYRFEVRFDRKRGKTEARLLFERDGLALEDPLNEVGGGVVDVAALALRLACIMLSRPPRRRLLVLDEPFRNIRGRENKQRVRRMLLRLAEDTKFQFLLNCDAEAYPEFALGKIIELTKGDSS